MANVRAQAEREGPEWAGADEAAELVSDAEAADRIRRRPEDEGT